MADENKPLTPLPTPTAKQLERLKTWDSSVRVRALIEQGIVRKTIEVLIAAGYEVSVNDGDETTVRRSTDIEKLFDACFTTDEEHLYAHKPGERGSLGWIYFVYGNTGWDVMADHTVNLDETLKPVSDYSEAMSAWC